MAVEPAKIRSMMEGRTLSGDNIRKMYQMVKEAEGGEDTEKKKQVMKHSVFFAGQLPLLPGYEVDMETTRKYLLASVPYDSIDEYMDYLTEGIASYYRFDPMSRVSLGKWQDDTAGRGYQWYDVRYSEANEDGSLDEKFDPESVGEREIWQVDTTGETT